MKPRRLSWFFYGAPEQRNEVVFPHNVTKQLLKDLIRICDELRPQRGLTAIGKHIDEVITVIPEVRLRCHM